MTAPQQAFASQNAIVERVISLWPSNADISPSIVADSAYLEPEIDPEEIAPPLARHLAKVTLRNVARGILGKKFDPKDEIIEQHDLWPDLQKAYPVARQNGEEPTYRPLENLTTVDYQWNISFMRKSAASLLKHADAMEQHGVSQGKL